MFAATMDELSGSRFNLGLAAGAGEFLKWVGIEQGATLPALRETIEVIRGLQAGERAAIDGRFLHWSSEAYLRFTAPRCTPIYIGAMGPKMLALSGELADGALPLLFPPEHYFGVLPYLQEGIARRGPGLGELDLAACIWVSLADDRAAARRVLAQKIAYYGHALGPLIWDRLGLVKEDFAPIEQAMMVERDEEKAIRAGGRTDAADRHRRRRGGCDRAAGAAGGGRCAPPELWSAAGTGPTAGGAAAGAGCAAFCVIGSCKPARGVRAYTG